VVLIYHLDIAPEYQFVVGGPFPHGHDFPLALNPKLKILPNSFAASHSDREAVRRRIITTEYCTHRMKKLIDRGG
jgi:hypothetical protein